MFRPPHIKTQLCAAVVLAALFCSAEARADRRSFAFIYEPKTMHDEQLEVEYYLTTGITQDRLSGDHTWVWTHQFEVEYGVTERFDLAMYQVFNHQQWLGYKLRARYRPWDYGDLPFDMMLYFEFIQKPTGHISLEEKIILGTVLFDRLIISLDSMVEQSNITKDVGIKLHEGLGIAFEVVPWFVVGLETQLRMSWEPKTTYTSNTSELEFTGARLYVGPTVAFAVKKIWWNFNVSFRVAGDEDDTKYLARILWGIFF